MKQTIHNAATGETEIVEVEEVAEPVIPVIEAIEPTQEERLKALEDALLMML